MSSDEEPRAPETPDEEIRQDPGIPGFDVISDKPNPSPPDVKDESAEEREAYEDPDQEGHMTAPEE
ncbi:MAG: hypothetical protein M3292_10825 [Actinomycetota bacterium]|jgi:hypothetical protein|nr:hypothetical protein [Actinomycetota bacterium]